MPLTTYCTEADMESLFSESGIVSHADHDNDGTADDGVVDACIERATRDINNFALQKYTVEVLAAHGTVNDWCIVLAVCHLCRRRGNSIPESLEQDRQEILADLRGIPSGKFKLGDAATRANFSPSFSNPTVDRRYSQSKIRIMRAASDGIATALNQKTYSPESPAYE
jgi:phage gp36-like protein